MSFRHVVSFRFVEGTTPEQVQAMADGLRELPGIIPEMGTYLMGPDVGINADSWDFTINADFASEADYLTYRDHPEHQARIASLVKPILGERASVQFTY